MKTTTKSTMKKIISFVLAAIMLLCAAAFAEGTVSGGGFAGMPNPMVETDAAGVQAFGIPYSLPEGAENVQYFIIADEMVDIRFTLGNREYTVRMAPMNEFTDISGYCYDGEETDVEVRGIAGKLETILLDDGDVQIVEFYDAVPGIMYSVSVKAMVMNDLDLPAEAADICIPAQGECDGEIRSMYYENTFEAEVEGTDVIAILDRYDDGSFGCEIVSADAAGRTEWDILVPAENVSYDNGTVTVTYPECHCVYIEGDFGKITDLGVSAGKLVWQDDTLTWDDEDLGSTTFTAVGTTEVYADFADSLGGRAVLTARVSATDDTAPVIMNIHWANSAFESCTWIMSTDIPGSLIINNDLGACKINEFLYSDCICYIEKYDENGDVAEYEWLYENGTGSFVVDQGDNGLILNWMPDGTEIGGECSFEAIIY